MAIVIFEYIVLQHSNPFTCFLCFCKPAAGERLTGHLIMPRISVCYREKLHSVTHLCVENRGSPAVKFTIIRVSSDHYNSQRSVLSQRRCCNSDKQQRCQKVLSHGRYSWLGFGNGR